MTILDYRVSYVPHGWRKIFYLNWNLLIIILAITLFGFIMLVSVSGGDLDLWVKAQMYRFAASLFLMFVIAFIPINFWRRVGPMIYLFSLFLLLGVELFGVTVMGAKRWIDLGFIRLQPSELVKVALVIILASYYSWLTPTNRSRPLWVCVPVILILVPAALVLRQPDLGTALLLMLVGGIVMFVAGVHWAYFGTVICAAMGVVFAAFRSRGTSWQILEDYQYRRIDTFLNPESDPLAAGYHIMQSKIAFGAGGWTGRGFMQGTQNQLNFLPEKHTDFIFTTLAEEFGFIGGAGLLALYGLALLIGLSAALFNRDRFSNILISGICANFFLYFATNIAMVTGLAPVVGIPLPLVSYGGSSMLVIMASFGLLQSAHIHRVRYK